MKGLKISVLFSISIFGACATTGSLKNSGESSRPINQSEETEYKKALIRCHKTGGSRVVKIDGVLRCF